MLIDLHTHTLFSDGVLLPSELVYRAKVKGYGVIAITDHVDASTIDFVIPRIKKVAAELTRHYDIKVLPGVEITYVPPVLIPATVKDCRKRGAKIVVVHGETPAETVPPGTNRAGIMGKADILAHPGHITEDEVRLAAKNGVCLEITTRDGHNKTNPWVAKLAMKCGADLVLDTDTHAPENLLTMEKVRQTLKKSALPLEHYAAMVKNSFGIAEKN